MGHAEIQSWQAVHFWVKCHKLNAPGGITGYDSGFGSGWAKSAEGASNPASVAAPPAVVIRKLRLDKSNAVSLAATATMSVFHLNLYLIAFSGHESRQFMHPTQRSKSSRCFLKSMQFDLQTPSHVPQALQSSLSTLIRKKETLEQRPKNIPAGQITLQYHRFFNILRSMKNNNRQRERTSVPLSPAKIFPLNPKGSSRFKKNMF